MTLKLYSFLFLLALLLPVSPVSAGQANIFVYHRFGEFGFLGALGQQSGVVYSGSEPVMGFHGPAGPVNCAPGKPAARIPTGRMSENARGICSCAGLLKPEWRDGCGG